jgi:hypothetical protein
MSEPEPEPEPEPATIEKSYRNMISGYYSTMALLDNGLTIETTNNNGIIENKVADSYIDIKQKSSNDNGNSITITTTGVGIGTTTPSKKLEVDGDISSNSLHTNSIVPNTTLNVSGAIRINGGNTSSDYLGTPGLSLDSFINTTGIVNNSETGTSPSAITFGNGSTLGSDQISLVTGGNTRMYINSSGNIGIGTTSPGSMLDVNGSIQAGRDYNVTSYFGGAAVGHCGYSDHMSIAHIDKNNTTDYALLQSNSGITYLNATETLYLRIKNSNQLTIDSGAVSASGSLDCSSFNTSGSMTMGGSQFYLNRTDGAKIKYKDDKLNWENNDGTATKEHDWRMSEYSGTTAQVYFRNSAGSNKCYIRAVSIANASDDRLKVNEVLLTNATETIMKLKPQLYDHFANESLKTEPMKSVGLIAQEIYYDAPELRDYIVNLPVDTSGNRCTPTEIDLSNQDPANDPDYEALGWTKDNYAAVDYVKLIPYLIKSNQEQQEEINTLKTQLTDVLSRLSALENN